MDWAHQARLSGRLKEAEAELAATTPGTWAHTLALKLVTRRRNTLQALYDRDAAEMAAYRTTVERLRREGAIPPKAGEEPV